MKRAEIPMSVLVADDYSWEITILRSIIVLVHTFGVPKKIIYPVIQIYYHICCGGQ